MLRIGPVELDGTPRVVIAVRDGAPQEEVRNALEGGASIVELRIDQFSALDEESVLEEIEKYKGVPTLATIRSAKEGGDWTRPEAERLALFRAVVPHVDAVDIELSSKEILAEVLETAHAAGKPAIGSYHDFSKTPAITRLAAAVNDGVILELDIVKIAAYCKSWDDLKLLARFTLEHADKNLITVGMGPHGAASRIFFPVLGSLLTYTFAGEPTAPGQLNCDDTLKYLLDFFPGFRKPAREEGPENETEGEASPDDA